MRQTALLCKDIIQGGVLQIKEECSNCVQLWQRDWQLLVKDLVKAYAGVIPRGQCLVLWMGWAEGTIFPHEL